MEADRRSYLSVENLSLSYGQHHVLEDISFEIERGQFVCVIGPERRGKIHAIEGAGRSLATPFRDHA
jgi:ABC-type cobalamin/Fe3+-siderophores transport system ATPase subunit